MALRVGNALSNVASRWSCAYRGVAVPSLIRGLSSQHQPRMAPRAAAAADDDMLDEDMDWTEDLPVPVKRRVQALKEVQTQYDKLMREFIKERATLAAKYETAAEPMRVKRLAIIEGREEVGSYDIADSDEKDEGIPDFWLTAMSYHDIIGEFITERDAEVLHYLQDIKNITLTGEEAGSFKLEFHFAENPFFKNKVLEKTFYMDNPDEVVPDKFVGTTIEWAPGKDTTVEPVKKKTKGKKGAPAVVVTQTKPCDSFFNFFKTPAIPENPADMGEEELDMLQQQMDEDFEMATALKESLIPRAVEWYTGELTPERFDDALGADFDEDEFEETFRR